jgi:mRNA interferase RelE/StbE
MYRVAFERSAEREFLELDKRTQEHVAAKIIDLKNGIFSNDKALRGNIRALYRKADNDVSLISRIVSTISLEDIVILMVGTAKGD